MKKLIAVLAFFALVTVGAFAQVKMSVGGGLLLDYSGGNGVEASAGGYKAEEGFDNLSFGFYGFFDATYVEASIYLTFGEAEGYVKDNQGYSESGGDIDFTAIGFTILGKYPFDLGSITLFPYVGIGYNMIVSTDPKISNKSDLNQFSLLLGGGLDYDFTEKLFLRASALFQIRFASKLQDDAVDAYKDYFGSGVDVDSTWGMGPVIKVGIGYRF